MELLNLDLEKNITFVRPAYFILSGFIGIPDMKYYHVFLFFVYIVSVPGNIVVMVIIFLDHTLRTPKYIAVFNLAFADLFGSSAVVPKVFDIFQFDHRYIPYDDCFTFMFFCYACLAMEPLNLVALAYDRLIAISFPLHYQVKVTHRFMFSLIAFSWLFASSVVLFVVVPVTTLSYCKSVVINSYFCDYALVHKLACNENAFTLFTGHSGLSPQALPHHGKLLNRTIQLGERVPMSQELPRLACQQLYQRGKLRHAHVLWGYQDV
uniref:olfactory receptor 1E5-like n=1 Tax=Monopterus albus TaxID=43700 RepID=UPI0009B32B6D|nr:olfactory receptor 1E5-like [Monopterus albus]